MEKAKREEFFSEVQGRDVRSVLEKEDFVSSSELKIDIHGCSTLRLGLGKDDPNQYWLRAQARIDVGEYVRIIYDPRSITGKEVLCLEVLDSDWKSPVY